ncbi:MAG: TSUP family transporter [Myxococcales bacterium]
MSADTRVDLLLAGVAFLAAVVNGGLGYGFSSLTVPVALLFKAGRVLNPALVLIELPLNAAALFVNRRGLSAVLPRVWPLLAGAVPGTWLGGLVLASVAPGKLKLFTFAALLPLLLAQSAGWRRPLRRERALGLPAGAALGALYGATTISGPPLALLFNNQGFSKDEFRAALAAFRIVESACTLAAYLALGLVGRESLSLGAGLFPAVLAGVPLGFFLLRGVAQDTFRRTCIAVDVVLVAFGLSRALLAERVGAPWLVWTALAAVALLQAILLGASELAARRPGLAAGRGRLAR